MHVAKPYYVYLVPLAVVLLLTAAVRSQPRDHFNRSSAEARKNWGELRQNASRPFSVKATIRQEDSLTKKPKVTSFVVKQNGDWYLFEITTGSGIPNDRMEHKEVQAMNSRYSFVARDQGSGWVLAGFDNSAERALQVRETAKKLGFNYLDLAWTVAGHPFPEAFDTPGFKVINFKAPGPDQGGTEELMFSVPKSVNPSKDLKVGVDMGKVEFDKKNNWRISKYEYTLPAAMSGGTVAGTIQYLAQDGFIDHITQTLKLSDKYQQKTMISTDSVEFRDVPEQEFTLSAYGLPEPEGVTWERPTPMYVWLLAAAGGCVAVALLFRWLVRHRQAVQVAA